MPKPRRDAVPDTLKTLQDQLSRKDEQNALLQSLLHDANRRADEQQRLLDRILDEGADDQPGAPAGSAPSVPPAPAEAAPDEPFEVTARLDRRQLAAGHAAIRRGRLVAAAAALAVVGSLAAGVAVGVLTRRPARPAPAGTVLAAPPARPSDLAPPVGRPSAAPDRSEHLGRTPSAIAVWPAQAPARPGAEQPHRLARGAPTEPGVSLLPTEQPPAPARRAGAQAGRKSERKRPTREPAEAAARRRDRQASAARRLAAVETSGARRERRASIVTVDEPAPPERWADPPSPRREGAADLPGRRDDPSGRRPQEPGPEVRRGRDADPALSMDGSDPERRVTVRICTDTWLRAGRWCDHTTLMNMPLDHVPARRCTARHGTTD